MSSPPGGTHHHCVSSTLKGRHTARVEGDFVVFLIGARVSPRNPIQSIRDLGGPRGMKSMLDYLMGHPEKGLLGYEMGRPIVQYWRSLDHLEAFAKDASDPHLAAWRNYWKRVGDQNRTGIWHETYLVRAGEYEAVHANIRPFGLTKAGEVVPLKGSSSARTRLRNAQEP